MRLPCFVLRLGILITMLASAACQTQQEPRLSPALPPVVGAAPPHHSVGALPPLANVIRPHAGETLKPSPNGDYELQKVFFATDRVRTGTAPLAYGGAAGELTYGYCFVSIPRNHMEGAVESPTLWRVILSRPDPEKAMLVMESQNLSEATFYRDVYATLMGSQKRKLFIFVHGYNVAFDDAIKRAAQIAYDLKFAGAPMLYSWPSKGEVGAYSADEASAERTAVHLEKFIADAAAKTGAQEIYLIAHSMGNRPVSFALNSLAKQHIGLDAKIKEIFLAAPDIDAATFREAIAPGLRSFGSRITVYMSDKDKALRASDGLHRGPRLGQTSGYVAIDGIDMIDATPVDTDFLSHSYFAQKPALLSDMYNVIEKNTPPGERAGLRQLMQQQKALYWQFAAQR